MFFICILMLTSCKTTTLSNNSSESQTTNVTDNSIKGDSNNKSSVNSSEENTIETKNVSNINTINDTTFTDIATGITINLPDTWAGNFYTVNEPDDEDEYDTTVFTYYSPEKTVMKGTVKVITSEIKDANLMFLNIDKTDSLIKSFGNDFEKKLNAKILGEYGDYTVLISWPSTDNITSEDTLKMIETAKNFDFKANIPSPPIVPDNAKNLVSIINKSRDDKQNLNYSIIADPDYTSYTNVMNLNTENLTAFAISTSLTDITTAYNISIIKPVNGHEDEIISSLKEYANTISKKFKETSQKQYDIANNATIKNVGDYIVFVMCENSNLIFDKIQNQLINN